MTEKCRINLFEKLQRQWDKMKTLNKKVSDLRKKLAQQAWFIWNAGGTLTLAWKNYTLQTYIMHLAYVLSWSTYI